MSKHALPKPNPKQEMMAVLRGYFEDAFRLDIRDDPVREEIFARQLEATTAAVRWLAPVLLIVTSLTVILFWRSGNTAFLLCGEAVHWATCLWCWRTLPTTVAPDTARRAALLHIRGAIINGASIATVSIGVAFGQGIHTAMFNSCWQLAFLSVGLVFYVNLPIAFFIYALPIGVPFVWPFLMSNDHTIIIAPFLLIYLCVLTRMGIDQNRMFVAAGRDALSLRKTEAIARAAAEEKMHHAEQTNVTTRVREEERRRQMLALAGRFESNIVVVTDTLSSAADGLNHSARQMTEVTRYSAATAEDVATRTANAARSVATVAAAANELAHAIGSIATQIDDHAALSGRATRSAADSETNIALMSEEAARVSDVVTLIKNITVQTRLLALNATIEAARAGEAGHGFSVVAQEVKTLANRAADATGDVTDQVATILARIEPAVTSIKSTAREIDGVALIASTIASSITQQRLASDEIDRETDKVAHHVDDIRSRMADLVERTHHAGALTDGVSGAAEKVSEQAETLQRAASHFLRELRAS